MGFATERHEKDLATERHGKTQTKKELATERHRKTQTKKELATERHGKTQTKKELATERHGKTQTKKKWPQKDTERHRQKRNGGMAGCRDDIAQGSLSKLYTQLDIAVSLGYLDRAKRDGLDVLLVRIDKMLYPLIRSLRERVGA